MWTPLYQIKKIRQLETLIFEAENTNAWDLMQRAARASVNLIHASWPNQSLAVICGCGKNAGDGLLTAYEARLLGYSVSVYTLFSIDRFDPLSKKAYDLCIKEGLSIQSFQQHVLQNHAVIIDAILGIGVDGPVSSVIEFAIQAINLSNKPVLSLDVPSGIDPNVGKKWGAAIKAQQTITYLAAKPGLFTGEGFMHRGALTIDDLGLSDALRLSIVPDAFLMHWQPHEKLLPQRKLSAHKGNFGHVLVIGGDDGMGGAVRMSAEAALRVGAGKVSVATRPEHIALVNSECPEIMCHGIVNAKDLDELIQKASVIVLGPGLGQSEWSHALFNHVLPINKPILFDADALTLLSNKQIDQAQQAQWILTPHLGEAARLLNQTIDACESNRFHSALLIAKQYHATCVLKGPGTIIQNIQSVPTICAAGNPGMATAGMGDVLSGVIGGLLAQELSSFDAANLGVLMHSTAADLAVLKEGQRGLLATDLFPHLHYLAN